MINDLATAAWNKVTFNIPGSHDDLHTNTWPNKKKQKDIKDLPPRSKECKVRPPVDSDRIL